MIAKLYQFYDLPYDHDTCHLFEHVVIREFLFELRQHGYSRAFFGKLHGNTIDSTIFFELSVYSEDIVRLFEDCLATPRRFTDTVIKQSIAHIEAEMRAEVVVADRKLLDQQLHSLSAITSSSDEGIVSSDPALRIIDKPKLFREIAVIVNVYGVSAEVRKAFLCLYLPLFDMIRDAAIDSDAAYPGGFSSLATKDGGIGIAQRFIVKKSVDLVAIQEATDKYMRYLDLSSQADYLDTYRNSFKSDPQYNAAPIQFYDETGIEATREEIAELATFDRMNEIIHSMSIRVDPIAGKLKKIEWQ